MKPGYRTTEFWLTIAAAIVGMLLASDVIPTDSVWLKVVGFASSALASMGYAYGRAKLKATAAAAAGLLASKNP